MTKLLKKTIPTTIGIVLLCVIAHKWVDYRLRKTDELVKTLTRDTEDLIRADSVFSANSTRVTDSLYNRVAALERELTDIRTRLKTVRNENRKNLGRYGSIVVDRPDY